MPLEMNLLSDQKIIGLVVEGKTDVFGELVARYQKPVFRLAYSLLTDRADAEDAAQEVFIKAFRSLSSYTESGRFWGWLRRITINTCLKKTHLPKHASLDELGDIATNYESVYESVVSSEGMRELRRMIHELPTPYRSVIVLKYLEDMSYAEIATALGDTVSNVQVRIHRAKKMLRERMKVQAL